MVGKFKLEDEKHARIAMRRLERQRGREGFGNARDVRVLVDKIRQRQADRIAEERAQTSVGKVKDKHAVMILKRNDVLGPLILHRNDLLQSCKAYQSLCKMEGMQPVKDSINDIVDLVLENAKREEAETPVLDVVLNRIFLGNPGTGRTIPHGHYYK